MKLTSLQNNFVKHLDKLKQKKYRDQSNEVLLEGEHLLTELQETEYSYKTIGTDESFDITITDEIAKKISQTDSGSQVFALMDKPEFKIDKVSRVFICDGIQNPGNLGTLIRTAYSFGIDALIVTEDCADIWSGKTLRSSQGAALHLPSQRMTLTAAVSLCKANNLAIYAADLDEKAIGLNELPKDQVAVILGSEGQGISDEAKNLSDGSVMIEMTQFESLNVAIAGAIIAYHIKK